MTNMPPLFNRQIFDIFKDQWIFDKLSGLDRPIFITPAQLAQRLAASQYVETNSNGAIFNNGVANNHYLTAPLPHLRQLNWAKLIQREFMDRQYTSHRISSSAAILLKYGAYDKLEIALDQSEQIDATQGVPDPYLLNAGW
jgi:hypothetical protein